MVKWIRGAWLCDKEEMIQKLNFLPVLKEFSMFTCFVLFVLPSSKSPKEDAIHALCF